MEALPAPGLPSSATCLGPEQQPSKQTKQEAHPAEELLKSPIFVTPHPTIAPMKAKSLQPLMLVHRDNIPLSYLDRGNPYGEFLASRFVESHIRALDLEDRLGLKPVVLVATSESTRKLYVLEREPNGLYVLCKLGSWVELESLGDLAIACNHHAMNILLSRPEAQSRSFSVPLTTPQEYWEEKERQRAIAELKALQKRPRSRQPDPEKLDVERPHLDNSINHEKIQNSIKNPTAILASKSQLPPANTELDANLSCTTLCYNEKEVPPPPPQELCDNIRNQYLEILYHSKGSVAYFAKGPLSRARAAFNLDLDQNLKMDDLVNFLKSMLMTTVIIDKKYRDTISETISSMRSLIESSDDEKSKQKKRRTKKMKLKRDGFYPHEDKYVRGWWQSIKEARKAQLAEDETMTADEMKYHIENLRTRETLLQIILILEILALELSTTCKANDRQLPGLLDKEPRQQRPTHPKKNRQNLPLLLDVHADRLCIWQSTAIQIPVLADSSQYSILSSSIQRSGMVGSDPLRDFCVDVIVPFFSARLREQSDTLSQKLGGPSIIVTPPKPKTRNLAPKALQSKVGKPGDAAQRRRHMPSSNSLEQAISRDRARRSISRGPGDALAALRAATLQVAPKLKREASSDPISLAHVPLREERSDKLGKKTAGVAIFGNTNVHQKTLIDTELKDAISAIKRPNRVLAGKAIVEESEWRSLSQLKKKKRPAHQQVQVKATPANCRHKDFLGGEPRQASFPKLELPRINEIEHKVPSPSVPSSASHNDAEVNNFSLSASKVTVTPSRPGPNAPSGLLSAPIEHTIPLSSPLVPKKRRHEQQEETSDSAIGPPTFMKEDSPSFPMTPTQSVKRAAVWETPLKNSTTGITTSTTVSTTPKAVSKSPMHVASTPLLPHKKAILLPHLPTSSMSATSTTVESSAPAITATDVSSKSIYQQLGWDDDEGDPLLL